MSKAWLKDLEEKVQEAAQRLVDQKTANRELEEKCLSLEMRIEELETQVSDYETQVTELEAEAKAAGEAVEPGEWQEEKQEIQQRVEKLVDHLAGLLAEEV